MEPHHHEEYQIGNGNVRYLELLVRLLVEVEVAIDPTEFDEEKVHEVGDQSD